VLLQLFIWSLPVVVVAVVAAVVAVVECSKVWV
jgi:hypothetical protein